MTLDDVVVAMAKEWTDVIHLMHLKNLGQAMKQTIPENYISTQQDQSHGSCGLHRLGTDPQQELHLLPLVLLTQMQCWHEA